MPTTGQVIIRALLTGAATEAGKDLYKLLKDFIADLPEQQQRALISPPIPIVKPTTFLRFELDRLSNEAASKLISMPPAQRAQLVQSARSQAGDEQQVVLKLLQLIQHQR